MKRILPMVMALSLMVSGAEATILPATGVDESFQAWTGIEATPAVILCESLSILDQRGDQGGQVVEEMSYSGATIPVIESWDGYAKIYYADGQKTGWVRNEYLLMDPAWYLCDQDMQVYAYPDLMAPRIAWLNEGTKLPILTEEEKDGQGWVCVSLRAAAGWIRKTPKDTVNETWFRPEQISQLTDAKLDWNGKQYRLTDPEKLQQLSMLLTSTNDLGGPMAGCPFGALLHLTMANGTPITLELATDSCCVFRVDGRDYQYARLLQTGDAGVDNRILLALFGMEAS